MSHVLVGRRQAAGAVRLAPLSRVRARRPEPSRSERSIPGRAARRSLLRYRNRVLRLFHVSDQGPFTTMNPRPSPAGTPYEGREWVWAVDETHLPNYLLPRDCPRVCWATPNAEHALLSSPAARVIAIEHHWAPQLLHAGLNVHQLEPQGFTLLDATAGYWINEQPAPVQDIRRVENCFTTLAEHDIELRLTPTLWPYLDAVTATSAEFSGIRMRNAHPRDATTTAAR